MCYVFSAQGEKTGLDLVQSLFLALRSLTQGMSHFPPSSNADTII